MAVTANDIGIAAVADALVIAGTAYSSRLLVGTGKYKDLDETRHVCALEVVREPHVHVERGDSVLDAVAAVRHPHRMTDGLDSDLVDGEPACVCRALYIWNREVFGRIHDWAPRLEYMPPIINAANS